MVLLAQHLVSHPDNFGGRIPRHFEGLVMVVHSVGSLPDVNGSSIQGFPLRLQACCFGIM